MSFLGTGGDFLGIRALTLFASFMVFSHHHSNYQLS
jgi:hypothetical protein